MKYIFYCLFLLPLCLSAQKQPLYKDPKAPVPDRVRDLLQRMTPEEKFWQLFMIPGDLNNLRPGDYEKGIFGLQVSAATSSDGTAQQLLKYNTTETAAALATKINSIQKFFVEKTRLGIPIIAFDEALHGLVRKNATAFPQSIGLAASFDSSLMHRVGAAIAVETRARGIRQILSPVVNIASDVRWGRTEETYGEDPFLSSLMGVAYVSELEKAGVISTPKHFLANVGDGGRDSYPIHWNERLLREIYLPPFEACFKYGGSRSVMTSYNSIDGTPASANEKLLIDLLKKEWGFKGFIISDAGAVGGANVLHFTAADYPESSKRSINGGLDVIFQTAYDHNKLFLPPFLNDSISPERIDEAVSRVLTAKFELGLFESPYVEVDTNTSVLEAAHRAIAKEAAIKSFVLLKNEKGLLPLSAKIKNVLVVGEDAVAGRLGGYSGPGIKVTSILEGLKSRAGNQVKIRYEAGTRILPVDMVSVPAEFLYTDKAGKSKGVNARYFDNVRLEGKPVLSAIEQDVNRNWTLFGPSAIGRNHFYSVEWSGYIKAPRTGEFLMGVEGNDGYRLYVNGKLLADRWVKQGYHSQKVPVKLQKDSLYQFTLQFYEPVGNAHVKLIWNATGVLSEDASLAKAVAAAQTSDIIIACVGIHEGEFQDRAYLSLPGRQEEMLQRLAATGKPVLVLLVGGSAITMDNWIDRVSGIMQVWYPGEAGGEAVAAVLFGDRSPSGKLPITFPKHESQLPLVYNHKPTGRGDDYHNLSGEPLFPFGFGLSYTQFDYSDLTFSKKHMTVSDSIIVSCTITNTGKLAGDEVVQLYIRDELASVARPVMELKGIERVSLQPGEKKQVRFKIHADLLKMYNENMEHVVEPGTFRIMIGSSSRDVRLLGVLEVK